MPKSWSLLTKRPIKWVPLRKKIGKRHCVLSNRQRTFSDGKGNLINARCKSKVEMFFDIKTNNCGEDLRGCFQKYIGAEQLLQIGSNEIL